MPRLGRCQGATDTFPEFLAAQTVNILPDL